MDTFSTAPGLARQLILVNRQKAATGAETDIAAAEAAENIPDDAV